MDQSRRLCTCGAAYATEVLGTDAARLVRARRASAPFDRLLASRPGGAWYTLRQLTSVVADATHHEPDRQAIRLVLPARARGFD